MYEIHVNYIEECMKFKERMYKNLKIYMNLLDSIDKFM